MSEDSNKKRARMSLRAKVNIRSTFETPAFKVHGSVTQLSEGGMLFCCQEELSINTRGIFMMRLFADEAPVWVSAEVIYRLEEKAQDAKARRYGVKFRDLSPSILEMIGRVLRSARLKERYSSKDNNEGEDRQD